MKGKLTLVLIVITLQLRLAFCQQTFEQMYTGQSWGNGSEFTDELVWNDTVYVTAFNRYNGTCDYNSEIIFFDTIGVEIKRIYVPNAGETDLRAIEKGKQDNFFATGIQTGCWDSDYVFILNADYLNGLVWYKQYGNPIGGGVSIADIIATPDSGCIIFYTINSTNHIRKLNKLGNTIYHKVDSVSDSGFLVSTDSELYFLSNQFDSLNNPIPILTKYSMNMDSLSSIILNANSIFGSKIILSHDSNFVMFGSFKDSLNHFKFCIAKLDTLWNLIWKKTLPDSIFQYTGIAESPNGEFLMSRINWTNPASISSDVIRFNSIGDSISGKKYSNFPNTTIASLSSTIDGGYFAVGVADSALSQLPYMLKADSLGNVTSARNIYSKTLNSIQVYPNPASDFITVKSNEHNSSFTVWNTLGIQVAKGNTNLKIDISGLGKGLYFVKVDGIPIKFLKQ